MSKCLVVIRNFDDNTYVPIEMFIGLQQLKLVNAQSIFNKLSTVLNNLDIQWMLYWFVLMEYLPCRAIYLEYK